MMRSQLLRSRTGLAVVAAALIVVLSGCAALTTLIGLAAAYDSIKSLWDGSGDTPKYELAGYVFIDRTDTTATVTIRDSAEVTGNYVPFTGATLILNTPSPMHQVTNSTTDPGHFDFKGIPTSDPTLILTVELPGATPPQVQFDVTLTPTESTITPHTGG